MIHGAIEIYSKAYPEMGRLTRVYLCLLPGDPTPYAVVHPGVGLRDGPEVRRQAAVWRLHLLDPTFPPHHAIALKQWLDAAEDHPVVFREESDFPEPMT